MSEEGHFTIHLEQLEDYEFKVRFDREQLAEVLMDEPAPLGSGHGPNASRMLAAAVGNCLSASLMYCLARADVPPHSVKTQVTCSIVRNERKRLRVGGLGVRIALDAAISETGRLKRCLDLFEDFCVVTASIREGIPVAVTVTDTQGEPLTGRQA